MTKVIGEHAAKHAKSKSTEISPFELTVKFSPELRKSLNQVIENVSSSPDFDGKFFLFKSLQNFAKGNDVLMSVRLMKDITEGIAAHTAATKDTTAKNAWEEFSMQLIDPPRGKPPFTLVQQQREREPG